MKTAREQRAELIGLIIAGCSPETVNKITVKFWQYEKQLCREQRQLVANEVKTWTEDISIPNQYKINDICMNTDMPDLT